MGELTAVPTVCASGKRSGGDTLYIPGALSACQLGTSVRCAEGGWRCVPLRVCACARVCVRLSHVLWMCLARVRLSCVKGISILYNPNTLPNLVVASLVWVEVAFLL